MPPWTDGVDRWTVSESTGLPALVTGSVAGPLVVGYLFGVLAARATGLLVPVTVGPFELTLSAVAFPVLFWLGAVATVRPEAMDAPRRALLAVAAGVVGDELVHVGLRGEGVEYWSALSLAGSLTIGVVALAVVAVGLVWRRERQPSVSRRRVAAVSSAVVACSYLGFRASQILLARSGVPNDQRSLVLLGFEVHHATSGSLLVVFGALLLGVGGRTRRTHQVVAAGFALGCGFVADELPYLFYPVMTDGLYFGPAAVVGGALSSVAVIASYTAQWRLSRRDNHED